MTNYKVIGAGYTPVRAVIDRAAALIDRPTACFALVVTHAGLSGLYLRFAAGSMAGSSALFGPETHRLRDETFPARALRHAANSTTIFGRAAKACTRWNRPSPMAAKW